MIARSTLFVGSGHEELIGQLFDVRSAVEHLHGPYAAISAPDFKSTQLQLAAFSFKAEAIARYCLSRLFETPSLWAHFKGDDDLRAFWKLSPKERSDNWGPPMDTDELFGHFSVQTAAIQLGE